MLTELAHNLQEAVLHMDSSFRLEPRGFQDQLAFEKFPGRASGRSLSRLDGYFYDQDRFKERSYLILTNVATNILVVK